jgi:dTDP-4-amino-4,6-dideoxygalactose transaminase
MLRRVPPAGAPMRVSDLVRWGVTAASTRDVSAALRAAICARFRVRHAFLTSTGRAGLTLLLRAMRRLAPPERDEVVVPSYTCYSVAASIVKAGLRPRLVDISPESLDYQPDELGAADFSRVLAVIATNLYGLPNDLPALSRLARDRNVFLIDDAAQAMGATVSAKSSGTWGDAGLFSFDKGKNVSAIDGGVLVTDSDEIADALAHEMAALSSPGASASVVHIVKALAYFAMLRPTLYGIPARIPQLGLGKTLFETDFPLAFPDRPLTALALTMMQRLDEFTRIRVANAASLMDGLAANAGVRQIVPCPDSQPAYVRLPILFPTPAARDAAVALLNAAGIGATGSYPGTIADLPELQQLFANSRPAAANARRIARCIATLPTHPFVTTADIRRTIAAIPVPSAVIARTTSGEARLTVAQP